MTRHQIVVDYKSESEALDAEILGVVERWHRTGETLGERAFNDLALRLFEYQLRYNEPYARYCARLGVTSAPDSWERIPAVPAPAFKEVALTTFDPLSAALVFETSGTTLGTPGRHYMQTADALRRSAARPDSTTTSWATAFACATSISSRTPSNVNTHRSAI